MGSNLVNVQPNQEKEEAHLITQLGAHEVMEIHEVLTDTIDGINQFNLYRPHVKDPQLANILDNQIRFMVEEYNQMVGVLNQRGEGGVVPYRPVNPGTATPTYGLQNPSPITPNVTGAQLDDRDVASGMLGCAKASATMRMHAALECADPQLRRMLVQSANSCAEMAYETFQYMNRKGYYQVPTLKDTTARTFIDTYQPAAGQPPADQGIATQDPTLTPYQ